MELTLITDSNLHAFEDLLFMENHILGLPVIMVGVVDEGRPIAAGSMDVDGITGRIISVYTEESYQNRGAAGMLLSGFKELAASLKLSVMEADFVAEEKGTKGLFSSHSYQIFDGTEVSYISLDDALDSVQVKSYIRKASEEDVKIIPLNALTPTRQRSLLATLDTAVGSEDLEGFSPDLSAFVLGQYDQPMGCMLVREYDCDIIIDTLRVNEDNDAYIAALLGHLYNVLKQEKGTGIRIGFVASNEQVMDRVGEVIGYVMDMEAGMKLFHAVKFI